MLKTALLCLPISLACAAAGYLEARRHTAEAVSNALNKQAPAIYAAGKKAREADEAAGEARAASRLESAATNDQIDALRKAAKAGFEQYRAQLKEAQDAAAENAQAVEALRQDVAAMKERMKRYAENAEADHKRLFLLAETADLRKVQADMDTKADKRALDDLDGAFNALLRKLKIERLLLR